jgi:hypothetical protein
MSESGIFSKTNVDELVNVYIKTKLDEVGIKITEIGKDGTDDTVVIVNTDEEVPEATKSDICEFADDKGMTIIFKTAPSGC